MSGEVENGYTFRMGDHEITMRDSFASMLDKTQLTDCLLVCHSHKDMDSGDSAGTAGAQNAGPNLTNGHSPQASVRTGAAEVSAAAAQTEQVLHTHRVILSASSDYFRSIFSSITVQNNGVIAVVMTGVDFEDLKSIIDFVYKGQVSVGQSRIHKFLSSAQLLMVKGLMNIKLVSNDNQPIDESVDNEQIQRLRNEKRLLEEEIKAMKALEKTIIEKTKRETELELKKKLELEKSVLSEEKQRFEAEKMKFTIERKVFEKNKAKELETNSTTSNSITNCANSYSNKHIIVNNNSVNQKLIQINSEQKQTNGNELNANTNQRSIRESPARSGQTIRCTYSATNKTHNESLLLRPNVSETDSPVESEGRQLRKRIRLADSASDTHESTKSQTNRSDMSSKMEVEDEDEEVYEVDFSECAETEASVPKEDKQKVPQILVNTSAANDMNSTHILSSPTPQSAAIVASALAYHKTTLSATPTTPSQVNTRTLRRSTSSHGSTSTQSMVGDNGTDADSVSVKRKGPGRTPHWKKEQLEQQDRQDTTADSDGTPETRARRQTKSEDARGAGRPSTGHLYSCPYCPQVYHGNQSMQDHINGVHLNSQTQYICDYCGKVYTWRISLNKHLKTVHPNEPIPD